MKSNFYDTPFFGVLVCFIILLVVFYLVVSIIEVFKNFKERDWVFVIKYLFLVFWAILLLGWIGFLIQNDILKITFLS